MKNFSTLFLCWLCLGCASRNDTAPIENATNVPSYLSSGITNNRQPTTAAAATVSPNTATASSSTTMGALDNNENNVKSLPVNKNIVSSQNSNLGGNSADSSVGQMVVSPMLNATSGWIVPSAGKTNGYLSSTKGVDIYGKEGQAIYASNDGKVVYSGNGLKGYGNLIIIKHDSTYLTAYAHNKANLVKEGASVKRGQKIAVMGLDDNGRSVLHFEVRKNGKPMDPFSLIKNTN
ncbi:MAG: peptidoglycan DD-metalloendopeptidase family protein [Burkholderiales bacterium]|nr:peptidoglycan DD-metalloendopeptidase family protein [Burkholderiales bacterium]